MNREPTSRIHEFKRESKLDRINKFQMKNKFRSESKLFFMKKQNRFLVNK